MTKQDKEKIAQQYFKLHPKKTTVWVTNTGVIYHSHFLGGTKFENKPEKVVEKVIEPKQESAKPELKFSEKNK